MGGGHEHALHEILFASGHADLAFAAAPLRAVDTHRAALDIAGMGDRHHHVLFGDEVLHLKVAGRAEDLGAAGIGVAVPQRYCLLTDDVQHQFRIRKNRLELGDLLHDVRVFPLDLLLLHSGEPLQSQLEDFPGLCLAQRVLGHEHGAGVRRGVGGLDLPDHRIQIGQRDAEPLQDVGAGLGPGQIIAGTPLDDRDAMIEKVVEYLRQIEHARLSVHDGQHDDPEGGLELGQLVEIV